MDWFRFSDNPDANYIMIEPNVKYMISSYAALAHAPKPWYDRPPPTPKQSVRVVRQFYLCLSMHEILIRTLYPSRISG